MRKAGASIMIHKNHAASEPKESGRGPPNTGRLGPLRPLRPFSSDSEVLATPSSLESPLLYHGLASVVGQNGRSRCRSLQ